MNEIFFIPSGKNNEIRQNDLDNGYLRITADNKKYFPYEDCDDIIIIVDDIEHNCQFRLRNQDGNNRSYTINLGQELISKLDIKTSDILECKKIGDKTYTLSK
jgi:hypothetical protein